jgi:hypothetical protein
MPAENLLCTHAPARGAADFVHGGIDRMDTRREQPHARGSRDELREEVAIEVTLARSRSTKP